MAANHGMHPIKGSEKELMPGARVVGPAPANERLDVTVRVRPRKPLPEPEMMMPMGDAPGAKPMSHEEYEKTYGASPEDLAKVEEFARKNNLVVVESSPSRRTVILAGTVEDFNRAFGVSLERHEHAQHTYRGRTGQIHVPGDLKDIVQGVFGLDDRPFARPRIQLPGAGNITPHAIPTTTFDPPQIAELYNFPRNLDGRGQTIAIIELGGGYRPTDLRAFFNRLNLPMPTVQPVSVDGGSNRPGQDADVEVVLDIEVAGAVAPGSKIVVYFAPDATDQSFLDAITQAVHDRVHNPSIVSISWGGPESSPTDSFLVQFNDALRAASLLGITVCVAAGDNGAADVGPRVWDGQARVDFPASSPYALACGGTHLEASDGAITRETVWNQGFADVSQGAGPDGSFGATGGGVSGTFPMPSWQARANVPASAATGKRGRGVPDVAGDADGATGYNILMTVAGQQRVFPVGGTSAVAPLWAGLIALINQKKKGRVGFINPALYAMNGGVFHDIKVGNNRVGDNLVGYDAESGWDACTGLGSPDGTRLMQALLGNGSGHAHAAKAAKKVTKKG